MFISFEVSKYKYVKKKYINESTVNQLLFSCYQPLNRESFYPRTSRCKVCKKQEHLVIANLNLRETVLKQKNAKHNSRKNKLVYSILLARPDISWGFMGFMARCGQDHDRMVVGFTTTYAIKCLSPPKS